MTADPSTSTAAWHRLSAAQRLGLLRLSPRDWRGALETEVQGNTLEALAAKGLARVAWVKRPHRRLVGRLTTAGTEARVEMELDELQERLVDEQARDRVSTDRLVGLWIAGRITRGELDVELDRRADIVNARHRRDILEVLTLDVLERLGPAGATVRELADLLAGEDLVVAGLVELEQTLERLGRLVRRRSTGQAAHNHRIYAALYPTPGATT